MYLKNQNIQINLTVGLQRLYSYTNISETDDELNVINKMNLRRLVAPIVRRMSKFAEMKYVNDILNLWRKYYESNETCLDIRNSYYDSI